MIETEIRSRENLVAIVDEIGFLPFFTCRIEVIKHIRKLLKPFHPKSAEWVGYVLRIDGKDKGFWFAIYTRIMLYG